MPGSVLIKRKQSPIAQPTQDRTAFCLMKYRNEDTGRVEWLWNSRDAVTPFGVEDHLAEGGTMRHVDWHEDSFMPNFVPPIGMRVFMSWADLPDGPRAERFARWHAHLDAMKGVVAEPPGIRDLAPFGMKDIDPCVVMVDGDLFEHFHTLASVNPYEPGKRGPELDLPKPVARS